MILGQQFPVELALLDRGRLNDSHPIVRQMRQATSAAFWDFSSQVRPALTLLGPNYPGPWSTVGAPQLKATRWGPGFTANGSTDYIVRAVGVNPAPVIIVLCVWIQHEVSTAAKIHYALGSGAVANGAYVYVGSGNGVADSRIRVGHRTLDGGGNIEIFGPTPEEGKLYATASIFASNTGGSCTLYVNGEGYAGINSTDATTTTLVNESVGALSRGTTGQFSPSTVLFAARYKPTATPDQSIVRELNNWTREVSRTFSIFESKRIWVPMSAGGGSTGAVSLIHGLTRPNLTSGRLVA